jgi:hypothetical protein
MSGEYRNVISCDYQRLGHLNYNNWSLLPRHTRFRSIQKIQFKNMHKIVFFCVWSSATPFMSCYNLYLTASVYLYAKLSLYIP